jgi:hypothetical protein
LKKQLRQAEMERDILKHIMRSARISLASC